jgi:DNA-binding transcriptional LysR family regulator
MDRLDAMIAFAATVEMGSLSGAAKKLGCSSASISRQISTIERNFGVKLLERTTRHLALTNEGRDYYEHVKRIVAEVANAERSLTDQANVPQGLLRISAPTLIGRLRLAPLLPIYLASHLRISIDLKLIDHLPKLLEEEIDVAIVVGPLPDSSFMRRGLGGVRRVLCAAPRYLESRQIPETPQDLAHHDCLLFTSPWGKNVWTFQISGRRTELEIPVRLRSNALDVVVAAAIAGMGIVRAPLWQLQEHVDAGRLRLLLEAFERPPLPLQMIFSAHLSRKAQSFVDFLANQWSSG